MREDDEVFSKNVIPEYWRHQQISWNGFHTTFAELRAAGWEIKRRRRFCRSEYGGLRFTGEKVYIINRKLCSLGRITFKSYRTEDNANHLWPENDLWELDFLCHRKQFNQRPIRWYDAYRLDESSFTAEDIPVLYQLIGELQREYPKPKSKKQKTMPMAEIIRLAA